MARILYIEDIEDNVTFVQRFLVPRGHELFWAKNAESGLEMAFQIRPDLILLDLLMPKISGFDFLQLLKSDEKTSNIPVMVVSAITDEEVIKRIMELGAVDFLKKPIDIQYLVDRVGDILIH